MSRKSLYIKGDRYGYDALELDKQSANLLRPLIEEYRAKGYGVREIAGIIHGAIWSLECELLIGD